MKQKLYLLYGPAYMAGIVLISRGLIRHLSTLYRWMDPKASDQILQALSQLQQAKIRSPWIVAVFFGFAASYLVQRFLKRRNLKIVMAILFILPLVALALWFTKINDIYLGKALRCILPLFL